MSAGNPKKRVWVVDSDSHNRQTIRNTLVGQGYDVRVLPNGNDALDACRKDRPDALVVATRLPEMDGFVFLHKLRQEGLLRCIPVLMTAEASEAGRSQLAASRGASAFLVKPVMVRKLIKRMQELTSSENKELLRADVRIPRAMPIEVKLEGSERFGAAVTVNISEGGMYIAHPEPPKPFTAIWIRFAHRPSVVMEGQVRHVAAPQPAGAGGPQRGASISGMGVRFGELDAEAKRLIAEMLAPPKTQKATRPRAPVKGSPTQGPPAQERPPRKPAPESPEERARREERELVERLNREIVRLKALPHHERLELPVGPDVEEVGRAFRKIAMPYHPDRFAQSREARRVAQQIYVLYTESKNELRPVKEAPRRMAATPLGLVPPPAMPRAPESQREPAQREPVQPEAPPEQEPPMQAQPVMQQEPAEREQHTEAVDAGQWLKALEETFSAKAMPPDDDDIDVLPVTGAPKPAQENVELASDAPSQPVDPPFAKERARALEALAAGRYRDAKNQLARLIDQGHAGEDVILADHLARGYLAWEEGQLDKAVEHLEAALGVNPSCQDAILAMREIAEERDRGKKTLLQRLWKR